MVGKFNNTVPDYSSNLCDIHLSTQNLDLFPIWGGGGGYTFSKQCEYYLYFWYFFQSDFKTLHSTESCLLEGFNDILIMIDAGNMMALVLLDIIISAFDFVDHNILLHRS